MNQKGALGLIVGIIIVAVVIIGGGIAYFIFSKGNSGIPTSGPGNGVNSGGISSSWCMGNPGAIGIETYRGAQTCHTRMSTGPATSDRYSITIDKEWWEVQSYAASQGGYILESHYKDGKCIEYSCSKNSGQAKQQCQYILSASCPGGVEVD